MTAEHYHRLKPGWRSQAYQFLVAAVLDCQDRGGRIVECRCLVGAEEIAERHRGRVLAFAREDAA